MINKALNIVFGFLMALSPLILCVIFCVGILSELPNYKGLIICGILTFFSIWLGIKIFSKIQFIGFFEFYSAAYASPDLDSLEVSEGKGARQLELIDFVNHVELKSNWFKSGSIRIFGDWFGKKHADYYELLSVQYDNIENLLTLQFSKDLVIEIANPKHLFEAHTYLKIVGADSITIRWIPQIKSKQASQTAINQYISYQINKNKVLTETNVHKKKFDVSLSYPALVIFG